MGWVSDCNRTQEVVEIIDSPPMFDTFWINDSFIMRKFIRASINLDDMYILNVIRMHLKAVTLSDIALVDGQSITFNSWMAIKGNGLRENIDWP